MCRVLGDLIHEGVDAKIADDLYCVADPPEELLLNWKGVLQDLSKCNLKLSPSVINPKSTMICLTVTCRHCRRRSPVSRED